MMTFNIPGFGESQLEYLVMDYNGTLAVDGIFIAGVKERLTALADKLELHIITADTFGLVKKQVGALPVKLTIIKKEDQAQEKLKYVHKLDAQKTVSIGNGRNDARMLEAARIGIACLQAEGAAQEAVTRADILVRDINDALDLLLNPLRLKATLRN